MKEGGERKKTRWKIGKKGGTEGREKARPVKEGRKEERRKE